MRAADACSLPPPMTVPLVPVGRASTCCSCWLNACSVSDPSSSSSLMKPSSPAQLLALNGLLSVRRLDVLTGRIDEVTSTRITGADCGRVMCNTFELCLGTLADIGRPDRRAFSRSSLPAAPEGGPQGSRESSSVLLRSRDSALLMLLVERLIATPALSESRLMYSS